ncbi:MAG TPA: hypothetical protein VGL84_01225, partial [Gaiellaceae bacterium]
IVLSFVAVACFALFAAGCGGGKSPSVANGVGATTTTSTQTGTAAFARCMRSNGVPAFPDPVSSGEIPKVQVAAAAKSNPKFNTAQAACSHLLPNGSLGPQQTAAQQRTQLADELSFAKCMRSHGVSRFPDPTAQGGLSVEMVQAQGIDVHSPQVLRVVQACLPASHGALTAKKVEEAINGAGG